MLNEYYSGDVYIRHAVDDCPDDKDFTMHIHEQCEIYFFVSGNVEYLVEGSKYLLDENSLMIMHPAEAHKPRIIGSERYERYAINFPTSFANSIDPQGRLVKAFTERSLGKNNMLSTSQTDMELVHKLFEEMCRSDDDYDRQLTIRTHLFMLLDMISRVYAEIGRAEYKPQSNSEKMIAYVNNHLFEEISVPKLAEHFYLSPSQFSRVFRQATGAAPWEYITKKRLTAAKEKIRSGSSAQTASESCGFGDYSSFYRAYTKHFNRSPTDDNNKPS
ncbi:MAG: helix-turn-helix domain-containing protein [Oscillospiraceae bacterium]|nr:helix-turn-helix domain-containing protein [Oscillospiraceae bacterium]